MKSKIIENTGKKLRLEVEIELDPTSMLNTEEQIQAALNEAGILATGLALKQFDTNGEPIEVNGSKMTSKGVEKKISK